MHRLYFYSKGQGKMDILTHFNAVDGNSCRVDGYSNIIPLRNSFRQSLCSELHWNNVLCMQLKLFHSIKINSRYYSFGGIFQHWEPFR